LGIEINSDLKIMTKTYLKDLIYQVNGCAIEVPIGLIINFNVTHIYKEGQKTYVNELYRHLEE
jgi:hypothetical protein